MHGANSISITANVFGATPTPASGIFGAPTITGMSTNASGTIITGSAAMPWDVLSILSTPNRGHMFDDDDGYLGRPPPR